MLLKIIELSNTVRLKGRIECKVFHPFKKKHNLKQNRFSGECN